MRSSRVDNYSLKKMHNCIKKAHNMKMIIIKCSKTLSDQVTVIYVRHIHNVNTWTMPISDLSISISIFFFFYNTYSVYTSNGEFQSILFVAELTEF